MFHFPLCFKLNLTKSKILSLVGLKIGNLFPTKLDNLLLYIPFFFLEIAVNIYTRFHTKDSLSFSMKFVNILRT